MEIGDRKINFFDLTISFEDNKFSYGIYRKLTTSDGKKVFKEFIPRGARKNIYRE